MAGSECQKGFEKTFSKLKRQSKTTATAKNTKSEKRRPLSIIYIITNIPTKSDLRLLRYDQKFTIHMFQSDNNCFFFNLQLHVLLFRIYIYIRSVIFFLVAGRTFNSLRHNPNQSVNPIEWFFTIRSTSIICTGESTLGLFTLLTKMDGGGELSLMSTAHQKKSTRAQKGPS